MSCEALVVGSDTSPVRELIRHKQTGLLVPFGNASALAETLLEALTKPKDMLNIRNQAREHIKTKYDLEICLKQQLKLIDSMKK